jgi:O-methyltransferase
MKKSDTTLRGSFYERFFYKSIKLVPYFFISKIGFFGTFFNSDLENYYSIMKRRKKVFKDIVMNIYYNRIEGDYFEFGCHSGYGLSIFHRLIRSKKLDQMRIFAFDSFDGFPTITGPDNYHNFKKGMLNFSYEDFLKVLTVNRMKDVIPIKGYFDDVLTYELQNQYEIKYAAIVFIDCDLYSSTKVVLDFIKNTLQTGTIVIFDDYWLFRGDQAEGGQKALSEFQEKWPNIQFREYLHPYSFCSKIFLINIV